jgi:nitrate reductase delta subunit
MIETYKVLSALLCYPTAELQTHANDLVSALGAERLVPVPLRANLEAFIDDLAGHDLLEVQAQYVDLFDRTKALSLHLFEHVHGESRDRGQAMVSLRERYRQAGVDVAANELPDFIPMFLEFLSILSPADARVMLADTVHILSVLSERLKKRGSGYALAFDALVALADTKVDAGQLGEMRTVPLDDPNDLAAIDRAWEETEVRFGPGDAAQDGCPKANDILRKIAPGPEKSVSPPIVGIEP